MKRIILLAFILIPTMIFAQDKPVTTDDHKITVSVTGSIGEPFQIGGFIEIDKVPNKMFKDGWNFLAYITHGEIILTNSISNISITGKGSVVGLGSRNYFSKAKTKGFYLDSFFSYGSIKYKENTAFVSYNGTYQYFSFVDYDLGYKFKFAKHFSIEPSLGFIWKIEIKGKGDVDNKSFDNTSFRGGLKMGYSFN